MALNLENLNRLYDDLICHQSTLSNATRNEKNEEKLKEIERELININNLIRCLLKTINYLKIVKK